MYMSIDMYTYEVVLCVQNNNTGEKNTPESLVHLQNAFTILL
jgi:hypothetical protein